VSICSKRLTRLATRLHQQCMKPSGFRKYGLTWNLKHETGIICVVNLQSHPYNVGSDCQFTVNLGVYVPLIGRCARFLKPDSYMKEYHCDFRERLSLLVKSRDHWWRLSEDIQPVADELSETIETYVRPWFAQYDTYEAIGNTWQAARENRPIHYGMYDAMIRLFTNTGQKDQARVVAQEYLASLQDDGRQVTRLLQWAGELGIPLDLKE
jgi:hypothetical protein